MMSLKEKLIELRNKLLNKQSKVQKEVLITNSITIEENKSFDINIIESQEMTKVEISDYISINDYYDRMKMINRLDVDKKLTLGIIWDSDKQCVKKGSYYIFNHNDKIYNILINEKEIIIEERTKIEEETQDKIFSFNIDDYDYHYFRCMHDKIGSSYLTRYYSKNGTKIEKLELSSQEFYKDLKGILESLESFKNIKSILNIEDIKIHILNELIDKSSILFEDFPPLKITEQTRQNVLNNPQQHLNCDVRVRMGKFYTDEEYEKRREEVLNTPLPAEEPVYTNAFKKVKRPRDSYIAKSRSIYGRKK